MNGNTDKTCQTNWNIYDWTDHRDNIPYQYWPNFYWNFYWPCRYENDGVTITANKEQLLEFLKQMKEGKYEISIKKVD